MQKGYEWLLDEPGPKMLLEAIKLYGTSEVLGKENSPIIMGWAEETGLTKQYSDDAVPWCGLFMAVIAKRAGKVIPNGALWALNWSRFGKRVATPMLGDVITFRRPSGGHVGLYVGEDHQAYHIFGGNQKDAVNIARIDKERHYSFTRPIYINQPANVRKIFLSVGGKLSTNEQ